MTNASLIESLKELIKGSRERIFRIANSALLETYWAIGKLIVENEQQGNVKAEYGKATLKTLSSALTLEFGKGYDYTNLTNMRNFYLAFPILDAVRQELSWTHYRLLSRLDSGDKRSYYLEQALTGHWTAANCNGRSTPWRLNVCLNIPR